MLTKDDQQGNGKIGSGPLRWAFGEAARLIFREVLAAEKFALRLARKHGKAKTLSVLATGWPRPCT